MPATHYDYVIVGAGAAGCAVANRLSADPNSTGAAARGRRPRLVTPGPHARRVHQAQRPALQLGVLHRPAAGAEQPADVVPAGPHPGRQHLDQRDDLHPRPEPGLRGLGGARQRGLGLRAGAAVLPRAEANERLNDRYHSSVGALNVTEQVQHNPLSKAFVRAAQELGVPFIADFNGAVQEGVGCYDVTQKNARRESTATAYLKPTRETART